MPSGSVLLDHHRGKLLNKKVAGVTKQMISLISSCCASPKAVTYDSFTDWVSQEEQKEISGRDQRRARVNEKSYWSLSQQDHTVLLTVLSSVRSNAHLNRLKLPVASTSGWFRSIYVLFMENKRSCCWKCFFMINIWKKSKQTAVTSVISVCAFLCVCGGCKRRAWGRQSASGQHVAPLWTATSAVVVV